MRTALIVEDDPVWARVLSTYCQQVGLTSVTARSPQEAMDMVDDDLPTIIVLDMLLATETGMAFLNELRTHSDLASIPVVVCTNVESVDLEFLKPFGVKAVLNKSTMEPDEMRSVLTVFAK